MSPILYRHHPSLLYSAGLLGSGSEVLGFDDPLSMDHHWGPRVMLFLEESTREELSTDIHQVLANELPLECCGFPTNYSSPDPNDKGVQHLLPVSDGPVNHRVELLSPAPYLQSYLGVDATGELGELEWLTIPQQKLLSVTSGALFRDDLNLKEVRRRLAFYPRDVWLFQIGACWTRVGQEEHLMGRAGAAGDEVGSAIIGARLVRDVMRLAFLMEQRYAPYPKWFGSAFSQLPSSRPLSPLLARALQAKDWREREGALCEALEWAVGRLNKMEVADPLPANCSSFWGRPFQVIWGERVAASIFAELQSPHLRELSRRAPLGGVDFITDNTDLLESPELLKKLRPLFASEMRGDSSAQVPDSDP